METSSIRSSGEKIKPSVGARGCIGALKESASAQSKREAMKRRTHSFSQEQTRTLQRVLTVLEEKEKGLENQDTQESSSSDDEGEGKGAKTIVAKDKSEDAIKPEKGISSKGKQLTSKTPNNEKRDMKDEIDEFQRLAKKKKKANKCWNAAQEIMTSEKSYVEVLKILDEFKKRIEKKIPKTSEEGGRIYHMNLFSILPQLLMLNSMLLEQFESRTRNWVSHPKIADVLAKNGAFLRIYSTYMDTFENTTLIFEECFKKYKNFSKIVKDLEKLPMCQGLGLSMHLLAPVQRLPRYKMLLETYLKYQEESGEDFEDTKKAIEIVSSATRDSNKGLREKEMMERMKKLQLRCEPFQLIQAGRHLLREGELHNVNNWEAPQPCRAILVTDSFFLACHKDAEDGLEIRHNFKLNTISAVAPANENLQFHIDLGSRTVLRLLVGTEQLRDDCVTEINDAVEKYKEAQKTLAVTNKVEETTEVEEVGDVKPVLFPNDLAENCQRLTCGTKFSWWGRGRHHCKCCGAVLCRCSRKYFESSVLFIIGLKGLQAKTLILQSVFLQRGTVGLHQHGA